ncbi:MAG: MBOAT family O-acyltransferase [bacterium]
MVFSSIPFLYYFLPLLLALYHLVPKQNVHIRNLVLLLGSIIFYAWGEGFYVFLLLALVTANHFVAKAQSHSKNATMLVLGIALNLIPLLWYKYSGFFAGIIGIETFQTPMLLLGISFFTFQALSFHIDLYRKEAQPPENLFSTALYIMSFPQLIAGPIVRYQTVADQLRQREETADKFVDGIRLFLLGIGQKVLVANSVAETADQIFSQPTNDLSVPVAWLGLVCYTLQIFFDFAGYSNMAMGLGKMFGFNFPRNFNYPYIGASIQEFWRRWHMTLSRWFRDYLYIPLGGNRKGELVTWRNLWIVFLLCGLWHGAAWTFVIWGAWHGAFLVIERIGLAALLKRAPNIIGHIYTILIVMLGWVLFRSESLDYALGYYGALFGVPENPLYKDIGYFISTGSLIIAAIGIVLATPFLERLMIKISPKLGLSGEVLGWAGLFAILIIATSMLAGDSYNPFIYFRF